MYHDEEYKATLLYKLITKIYHKKEADIINGLLNYIKPPDWKENVDNSVLEVLTEYNGELTNKIDELQGSVERIKHVAHVTGTLYMRIIDHISAFNKWADDCEEDNPLFETKMAGRELIERYFNDYVFRNILKDFAGSDAGGEYLGEMLTYLLKKKDKDDEEEQA